MSCFKKHYSYLFLTFSLALILLSSGLATADEKVLELSQLSIEELINLNVSTVSKKNQSVLESAAAVYVISQEDIRRSGALNVPELLRMVPGIHVGKINANSWAVTSRGFNDRYSNKLLVLIDGHSLYTSINSGVEWSLSDIFLDDVDRIEVIRGPGGTLWGANAVNGVINIITKRAKDSQGFLVSSAAGNEGKLFSSYRLGFPLSETLDGKIYAKYFSRDGMPNQLGDDDGDQSQAINTGFRFDKDIGPSDTMLFQGACIIGELGEETPAYHRNSNTADEYNDRTSSGGGGYLLWQWDHQTSNDSTITLKLCYDHKQDNKKHDETQQWPYEIIPYFKVRDDNVTIDFQHQFTPSESHEIVWGLGFCWHRDSIEYNQSIISAMAPTSRNTSVFSAFFQDEISFFDGHFKLIIGNKIEHNDYTGFENQPNGRLLCKIYDKHAIWGAISRAVRTPSRFEHDAQNVVFHTEEQQNAYIPLMVFTLNGNTDYKSENLTAYEIGYRMVPTEEISFDITGYYNHYDDLRTWEFQKLNIIRNDSSVYLNFQGQFENKMEGQTSGFEIASNLSLLQNWQLRCSYTYMAMKLFPDQDSTDITTKNNVEQADPQNQFYIRSLLDLTQNLELDLTMRYVDEIPIYSIEHYTEMSFRLGWRPHKDVEFSFIGNNLLNPSHEEYLSSWQLDIRRYVERSFYFKLALHY